MIVFVVVGLNIVDSNNVEKIEDYYKAQKCEAVNYVRGEYFGLCPKSIIVIKNGFSVDVSKPLKVIDYKDIQDIKKEEKYLKIITAMKSDTLEFKNANKTDEFYKKVQNKL